MIVALAGASTGIGHHIADGILEHGGHTLIILSRHEAPEFTAKGAHVKVVSFESKESLVTALEGVHTVISAIGDHSHSGPAQLALVQAAISANVTRFIPSGWSGIDGGKDDVIELYRFQQPVLAALRESKLEWSNPENGIFINYFATPTKGIGHLKPLKFWIDVENCTATIPGDGEKKLVYTAAEDVGKFIAKALDVPGKWPRSLRIVGSSVTHNEIVKIAEKIRGKREACPFCAAQTDLYGLQESPSKSRTRANKT